MAFPITASFAVIYTFMLIVLSTMVSMRRGAAHISMFHGDDAELALRIRRHGNFVEIMPFAIILMGLCEVNGAAPFWLNAMGICILAGRVAHVIGLDPENPWHPLRIGGGLATQLPMLGAMGYLVWKINF